MGDPNSWREPMIFSTSASLEDICLPTSRTKWPRNTCDDCPIHMGVPRRLSADKRRRNNFVMVTLSTWVLDRDLDISAWRIFSGRNDFWRFLAHIWVLGSFLGSSSFSGIFFRPGHILLRHRRLVDGSFLVQRLNVNT